MLHIAAGTSWELFYDFHFFFHLKFFRTKMLLANDSWWISFRWWMTNQAGEERHEKEFLSTSLFLQWKIVSRNFSILDWGFCLKVSNEKKVFFLKQWFHQEKHSSNDVGLAFNFTGISSETFHVEESNLPY